MDEIYSIKTKFIPSPYVIFTYYANVQKPLLPPSFLSPSPSLPHLSSPSLFDPLLIIALKDTVCTNRSRVARTFLRPRRSRLLHRFLLRKRRRSPFFFFFLPRNRKSLEGMGDGREERTRKNERRGPSRQMSRDPAGFYDSRVINAARTSILISKLTKLEIRGGTRRFFGNAGTRSRATGVLLFAEAGLKQRKKGNAS